ncbi:hypothetical protein HBJ16_001257 [Pseudomonas sp. CES]|nr:hypothetical protein HBJ16_001257 [Pseudomonas sp. CES]
MRIVGPFFVLPVPALSRVNPLPQGLRNPEADAVPVGAGLPAKRPVRATNYSNNASKACSSRVTAITCNPAGASFGALPLGTMARLKPCLAASFKRS